MNEAGAGPSFAPGNLPVVYLKPGEFHFAQAPAVLVAVVDACVVLTFCCRRLAAGAACHLLLPVADEPAAEPFAYATSAVRHLLERFRALGAERDELEVRLFGGANLLQGDGRRNIAAAVRLLEAERLCLTGADTGGAHDRKIYFHTHRGEVIQRRLGAANAGRQGR